MRLNRFLSLLDTTTFEDNKEFAIIDLSELKEWVPSNDEEKDTYLKRNCYIFDDLEELIAWSARYAELEIIHHCYENGDLVVFVDGVDEITSELYEFLESAMSTGEPLQIGLDIHSKNRAIHFRTKVLEVADIVADFVLSHPTSIINIYEDENGYLVATIYPDAYTFYQFMGLFDEIQKIQSEYDDIAETEDDQESEKDVATQQRGNINVH